MAAATFEEARADLVDLQAHKYRAGSALESTYSRDRGLLVIPVMGPAGTAPSVVRVHAPFGTRTVNYAYAKQDSPPLMPAAADTTSGDKILAEEHSFPAPTVDQEGKLIYGVRGQYTYVQPLGGRGPDDNFPIDAHPFPTGVDALGEFVMPKTNVLVTPNMTAGERLAAKFLADILEGRWNQSVVDSRKLSSYNIIG